MKKLLSLILICTSYTFFAQEIVKEAETAVKQEVEKVIDSKKEALETKAKEVVTKKVENASTDKKTETTTFYLITNGETKSPSEKYPDPYLNKSGEQKSETWIKTFANVKFDAVYAQELTSAKQTAQTIATSQKIGIYALETENTYNDSFKYNTDGKNILIVGNNAALAYFANAVLGEEKYEMPKIASFNDFYIVTVTKEQKTSILLKIE